MEYKKSTKFSEVIGVYPDLPEYLAGLNPKLKLLKNKAIVQLMAKKIDLKHVAQRGNWNFEEFVKTIEDAVETGKVKKIEKSRDPVDDTLRLKEDMKALLKKLYKDEDVEDVKTKFKKLIEKADPVLIAVVEGELTKEGYTVRDLMKACDVHMELFKEQISNSRTRVEKDHPLWRLIKDHDAVMFWLEKGLETSRKMEGKSGYEDAGVLIESLKVIMIKLKEAENHDVRQENTIFPVLERYGVEEPPAIMWEEHYTMREKRAQVEKILLNGRESFGYKEFVKVLEGYFMYLVETFALHTKKEQEILYNVALDLLSDKDWQDVKTESDELGYFELPKEVLENE